MRFLDKYSGHQSVLFMRLVTSEPKTTYSCCNQRGYGFVETVFHKNPTYLDYNCIPTAIFTKPEMGTVGLRN